MIYGRGFQNEASLYFVEWHGVSPQSDVASYRYYVSRISARKRLLRLVDDRPRIWFPSMRVGMTSDLI